MPDSISSAMQVIRRGSVHIFSEESLLEKLSVSKRDSKPLRIKLGADPSSSDLHLGHAVVLRKLRQFQDLGHKVVLIIGDFTAMIGDPTGKSKTRPTLTLEETRKNGETYVKQVSQILDTDPDKLEVVHNSQWLLGLNFGELIKLAQSYTVARMLERDDFASRYKNQVAIGIHELLYPLAQAYDSVAVRADLEMGGTDQLFNLLVGRDIQKEYGQQQQVVLTMPLLVGLDGTEKMSKSLNNSIGISEAADVMFKKAMLVPDHCLLSYFELCTSLDLEPVNKLISTDIRESHRVLARELVRIYHGEDSIADAESRYDQVAKGGMPEQMREYAIPSDQLDAEGTLITKVCLLAGLSKSNGECRRLIQGKGIRINGEVISDVQLKLTLEEPLVLQRGKDQFVRVKKA